MFDTIIEAINNFQYSRSLPFCNELVPYISCAIYIPGNIILSWLMGRWAKKNPEKSKSLIAASRKFSIVYNGFMVALSLFTFIAVVIGLTMRGMIHPAYLVCETTGHDLSGILGVASYTYYVTKYIEAIDTFFLCLRNKYITWLHLYHHGCK